MTSAVWLALGFVIYAMWGETDVRNPVFTSIAWMAVAICIGSIPIIRYLLWLPYIVISAFFIITEPAVVNNVMMGHGACEYSTITDWQMTFYLSLLFILPVGLVYGAQGNEKAIGGIAGASLLYNLMKGD